MNERDKARNIFGAEGSGVGSISNLTSDMWTPISATNSTTAQRQSNKVPQGKKPASAQAKNSSQPQHKAQKQKSPGYVSSSTGYKEQKKQAATGRISGADPRKNAPPQKPSKGNSSSNIFSSFANNKTKSDSAKKQAENQSAFRTPQSRNVTPLKNTGGRAGSQKTPQKVNPNKIHPQLTKREKESIRKDREMYEKRRKDGMSTDEIRHAAQQKKLKKRKAGMMVTFGVFILTLVLLLGGYIYYEGAIVENIVIEGKSRYSATEIIEASSVETGDNLFGVRENTVREKLTKGLPYVKDVSVKYKLPDTVVITVNSTKDKVLIVNKNKYLRLDEDGKVLSVSKTKMKDGMFRVNGLTYKKVEPGDIYEPDEKDKERYETVKQIISVAETAAGLTSGVIDVTNLEDITIVYDSRIKIYLGTIDDIESKLSLAMRTIKEAAPDKQTGYVDMRFSKMGYFSEGKMDNK